MEKKTKLKIIIGLAVLVVLSVLILLLIHFCSGKAAAVNKRLSGEQTEPTPVVSAAPEKKAEEKPAATKEEEKPAVTKQEEKTDKPTPDKILLFEIDARKNWQKSGVEITPEMKVAINFEKGKWTIGQGKHEYVGIEGYKGLNLPRAYPFITIGALIARVGSNKAFEVGKYHEIDGSDMTGMLSFRINDADSYLYDNLGTITVKIHIVE
ncbi:MAG: hypothetical protein JW822_12630 [Spirochaetales bacterium]|nr:hypothetical protein [Spirochaetales bacterium]